MVKLPLLAGRLERSAAALLLSVLLPLSMAAKQAFAGGEDSGQAASVSSSSSPAPEKKPEPDAKQPATEAAKAPSGDTKPADAKPAESKSGDKAAATQDSKQESSSANAKDSNAEKNSAVEAKPAPVRSGEASAATISPAAPKDAKSAAKPTSIAPGEASNKPKEILPRHESVQSSSIRPSTVNAVYNIHFLGAHIGDFRIHSSITNRQYSLHANADISVFFGAVNWKGVTSSYGLMTANGPVPKNYTFRYATSDKHEAVEIRFQQRMVEDIIINPPAHPGSRNVPITAADLQNVVDPLSAVILLSQARTTHFGGGEACDKRLPIFDGKIRYDLVLSPKGTRSIGNAGRLHGIAYVCRVNYVPVAGHKPGKATDYAAGNTGIEIWLVPMPEAGLLVPYYVHVPTPAGTASLVTAKFDIETSGGRHAFVD